RIVRAAYSNYGRNSVDIAAPGFANTPTNNNTIEPAVGTSIAAPFVTQIAAIIKANFPNLSAYDIRDCILNTAQAATALSDTIAVGGILDTNQAFNCAESKSINRINCPFLEHDAFVTDEVCGGNNGVIDLTVFNGTPPYNYSWSNGAVGEDLINLAAGCYRVDVVDANGCTGVFSITVAEKCGVRVQPKVYLQGPLQVTPPTYMDNQLFNNGILPYQNPYNSGGDERYFPIAGVEVVDWVLVELRHKLDESQIVAQRSAILLSSGDVVDMDGFSPVAFGEVPEDDYFVAIRHRNHLGVLSANTYFLSK
ncbi:MAG: S8 family serine peptidase, partial [Bacteroidota bacterium]